MKVRFLALWCAAVVAVAAAFVVHLAIRYETVRLGYEVTEARLRQRQLEQDRRLLSIEAETLRQAGRIEAIARGSLEMEVPEQARLFIVRTRNRAPVSSGRVR